MRGPAEVEWQRGLRASRRWRYDYEWLVEKYESGWSVMDLAHWDNCAPGTIEYHLEEAGVEVDGYGGLCPEFRADWWRQHEAQKGGPDSGGGSRESPKHEQARLADFA